jgi:hypothetical protein
MISFSFALLWGMMAIWALTGTGTGTGTAGIASHSAFMMRR